MKIVYYLKERKNCIVIFLCTFLLGLTINEVAVSDYALQFRHHSYKDPDIVYVYAQKGSTNWSNAVSSAVQNWNNARLPYSTKPIFAKGTISWELYISSEIIKTNLGMVIGIHPMDMTVIQDMSIHPQKLY